MARQYRPELKARDAKERFMARIGLPSTFWGTLLKDFSFRSTPHKGDKLSGVAQRRWCESIVMDSPYAPLFVVGSYPTDMAALAMVTWMLRHRTDRDRRVAYVNTAGEFNYRRTYTTIGVFNLTQDSTPQRCEAARDILTSYPSAFRVVAVATKTPEAWALNHLHLRPTASIYLKDL